MVDIVVDAVGGGLIPVRAHWEGPGRGRVRGLAARREVEATGNPVDAVREEAQQSRS